MGYTHYWKQTSDFTIGEWKRIKKGAELIIKTTNVPLSDSEGNPKTSPDITTKFISFNGDGDDAHETFYISKIRRKDFNFCKTARKPYDEVVVAILLLIEYIAPEKFIWSSDGNEEDHEAGKQLILNIKE